MESNTTLVALKGYFNNDECKRNLQEMLGKKAQGFATSVLSVVNSSTLLQKASAASIYNAAMIAASLDLPVNPNLGFAAIVPYGSSAQFQMMTRGFIQLAIRSGQYEKICNAVVHKGELVKCDPFTDDYQFDVTKRMSDEVIGYMAYFRTTEGFEKYYYMSVDEAMSHGKKYSKTFNSGPWKDNPEAMCLKTVLKLLLSKFGILSIEMQRAVTYDQAVMNSDNLLSDVEDIDTEEISYEDNPESDGNNSQTQEAETEAKKEEMRKNGAKAPEMP